MKQMELLSPTLSLWLSSLVEVFSALSWCSWSISSSLSERTWSTDIWSWVFRSLTWLPRRQNNKKDQTRQFSRKFKRKNLSIMMPSYRHVRHRTTVTVPIPMQPLFHNRIVNTVWMCASWLTVWDHELPPPGALWLLPLWSDGDTSHWSWTGPELTGIPWNKTNIWI